MVELSWDTRRAIETAGRFCLIAAIAVFFTIIATSNPAQADFTKAVYHGKAFCPKGTHYRVRKGGQCWSCPSGAKRTLLPITGKKACKKKSRKLYKKAVVVKKDKAACKKAGLKWKKEAMLVLRGVQAQPVRHYLGQGLRPKDFGQALQSQIRPGFRLRHRPVHVGQEIRPVFQMSR
jgi:hypothetical protein